MDDGDEFPNQVLAPGVVVPNGPEAASWLSGRMLRIGRAAAGVSYGIPVGAVVPLGFEAYVRVFHPAEGGEDGGEPIFWSEVAEWAGRRVHPLMQWEAISRPAPGFGAGPKPWKEDPPVGRCPDDTLAALAEHLERFTETPETTWVCVWDGFTSVGPLIRHAPRVRLPGRTYALLRAPLDVVAEGIVRGGVWTPGPNLWWPDDRAWCVATEVDFRWTFVAGSRGLIASIAGDTRLEALETRPEHRCDVGSDMINMLNDEPY